MKIFNYSDYKVYLQDLIVNSKDKKFRSTIISAMGCQKSFFSQVLSGNMHLTPDHAANLVEKLKWDNLTAEYFIALVNLARAATPALKRRIKIELDELKLKAVQPSEAINWSSINDTSIQFIYYSSWFFAAIHIISSIPQYNTAEKIAEKLGLSLIRVLETLEWLISINLIEKTKLGFNVLNSEVHLKNNSHLIELHHSHWRRKALENVQNGDCESVHYSAVFAMSQEDFYKLKEITMEFINKSTKLIGPSKSEEIYAMGVDVFRL